MSSSTGAIARLARVEHPTVFDPEGDSVGRAVRGAWTLYGAWVLTGALAPINAQLTKRTGTPKSWWGIWQLLASDLAGATTGTIVSLIAGMVNH